MWVPATEEGGGERPWGAAETVAVGPGARWEHDGFTWEGGGSREGRVRGAGRCESPPSKMEWIHGLGLYGAGALGSSLADASLPARPAPWPVAFFSRFSSSSAHSFSR